jgi:hypothetical protein
MRTQPWWKGTITRISCRALYFFSVALESLKVPGRLTYRRFLLLFRHMAGLLGWVISPSQGLYLPRTTQNRKTRTNIHDLSGIRTHDPSNQPAKTHASDRTVTVTERVQYCKQIFLQYRTRNCAHLCATVRNWGINYVLVYINHYVLILRK